MSQKRQLIIIARALWGGGAEKVTHTLVHAFDPETYEIHIVYLFEQENFLEFAPYIRLHSVTTEMRKSQGRSPSIRSEPHLFLKIVQKFFSLSVQLQNSILKKNPTPSTRSESPSIFISAIQRIWTRVETLNSILSTFDPDAILITVMEEATVHTWLSQALSRQRKYYAWLHSVESYNLKLMYPDPEQLKTETWLFAQACSNAQAVIVPSKGVRNDIIQNFTLAPNLVRIIPNPVDIDKIKEMAAETPPDLPSYTTDNIFIQAARLSPDKNHELTLQAARILKGMGEPFIIILLGKGGLYDKIQQQIQSYQLQENVFLLGEVNNPFSFFSRAKGVLLTSEAESFSLVLVEAMACGSLPISVDCPYGPAEILNKGEYGLLLPMNDPHALAMAMYRAITKDPNLQAIMKEMDFRAQQYDIGAIQKIWESLIVPLGDASGSICASFVV
jgi:glycosyltransferase involved in cell wall biosynthesis